MNADHDDEQLAESTGSTLRVLTRRTPVTSGWRQADTVRRAVVIRRRWRWGAGAGAVLLAAAVAALSLTSAGSGGTGSNPALGGAVHTAAHLDGAVHLVADASPVRAAGAASVDRVVAAEQKLGIALLRKLGDGSNVSVSPASLYLALGMLQNGAHGQTADQISRALQAGGLSSADQNAGLAALMAELDAAAAKDGISLDSANSLWQQRGFELRTAFLRTIGAYYHAGVWQVDYAHDMAGALKALNDWTSRQTHGKITKLFDHLDPQTVLVLADAIYFHAAWATPFLTSATKPGTFTTGAGKQVQAKFMNGGGLLAAVNSDYHAVQLPYRGGRFTALAVMPTSGSLAGFVSGLTPDKITSIVSGLRTGLRVSLPRFTTTSTIDLNRVLQALGMRAAFTDDADFSALSPTPTEVGQAIQRVYLGVGEKGTTAAAVTGISVEPTAAQPLPAVVLDHPFLFLVRDTKTGAVLFASEIQDPTAG